MTTANAFPRIRYSAVLLVQLLLVLGFGWYGIRMPGDNSIETFAVGGTRAETDFALLARHFPVGEQFVVALSAKDGREGGAIELLDRFAVLPGIGAYVSAARLFPEGIPDAFPRPMLPLSVEGEATRGVSAEPASLDRRLYVGYFQPEGVGTVTAAIELAEELKQSGLVDELIIAGEPVVNYYLDQGSLEVKYRFFPLLILCSLLLLGLLFRDLRVLAVAGFAVGGSLATTTGIMALVGETMNLVTNLIPALIFVLCLAMQVHVLIAIAAHGSIKAGVRAKIKPNFLIALTTSIGFGSLMTSQVVPIAIMGKYMALGMWLIFFWTHAVHFGLSQLLGLAPKVPALHFLMDRLGSPRYRRLIATRFIWVPALIVVLTGIWCLKSNITESNGLHYFKEHHPIRVDTERLQQQVTGASMLELLIEAPKLEDLDEEDAFVPEGVADLEEEMLTVPGVRHLISLSSMGTFAAACEDEELDLDFDERLLEPFISTRYYRIQLLVDSMDRVAYERLRFGLLSVAQKHGAKPILTGVLDRIVEIQAYLLGSLLRSLALTVFAVVVLLGLILGRQTPFLAVVFPNLFPLGVMAVVMYVLGIPTTISSVMVFSVAFGIAVDDTIHLLHGYLKQASGDHVTRWCTTIQQDARAITLTTVVLCLGFIILTTSSFLPTLHFGLLLSVGMVAALFGDLIFLPSLLRPGLGFIKRRRK